MAISIVQAKAEVDTASSFSMSLTSAPTAGNVLIGFFADNSGEWDGAVSQTNVTWSTVLTNTTAFGNYGMCVGAVSASAGTDVAIITESATAIGGAVIEVSGLATSTNEGETENTGQNHTSTTGNLVTTIAKQLLVAGHAWGASDVGSQAPTTPTNSFTLGATARNQALTIAIAYRNVSAASTYSTALPLTGVFDDSERFANVIAGWEELLPADVFPFQNLPETVSRFGFTEVPKKR